jgi:peptidyl-prolyl cis-trans isomerase A (cyclophilin A)
MVRMFVVLSWLAACSGGEVPAPAPAPEPAVEAPLNPTKPTYAPPAGKQTALLPADANPALLDPSKATAQAPEVFQVVFETTEGSFVVEVHRAWAPLGADRFFNLVQIGFFDDIAFFRAIDGFMVQFGITGYPDVASRWRDANIKDDPVTQSNKAGYLSFATAGPNTRTTQLFINYVDNANLDGMGFAPFGQVVEGMDVVKKLYTGYGEGAPRGRGPDQARLQRDGNPYLREHFPELDYVKHASVKP